MGVGMRVSSRYNLGMQLHIANKNYSSWSMRPWVLMTELGIPFTEVLHPFPADVSGTHPFTAFSPSGLVPCLHDGDLRITDSLAITEYLAETFPQVWPHGRAPRAWARSAASEMHAGFMGLRSHCSMNLGVRVKLRSLAPALTANLTRLEALWSDGLTMFGGPFLAGAAFTAVDAFFVPVAFRLQTYGLTLAPHAMAYADQLRALPSADAWYRSALAETFRDSRHDAEVSEVGTVLADLRASA